VASIDCFRWWCLNDACWIAALLLRPCSRRNCEKETDIKYNVHPSLTLPWISSSLFYPPWRAFHVCKAISRTIIIT
jgi:hypothetical protein